MSNNASAWAWGVTDLSISEKLTLLALADRADDEGICWPGHRYISNLTGLGQSTVRTAVKTLKDKGLIENTGRNRENGSRTTNIYYLDPHGNLTSSRGNRNISPPARSEQGGCQERAGGEPEASTPDPSYDPSVNNIKRKTTKKKKDFSLLALVDMFYDKCKDMWTEEQLREHIEESLNHSAKKKYNNTDIYVRNWLRRARNGKSNNSFTRTPTRFDEEETFNEGMERPRVGRL